MKSVVINPYFDWAEDRPRVPARSTQVLEGN
jgi:hypothetical protein